MADAPTEEPPLEPEPPGEDEHLPLPQCDQLAAPPIGFGHVKRARGRPRKDHHLNTIASAKAMRGRGRPRRDDILLNKNFPGRPRFRGKKFPYSSSFHMAHVSHRYPDLQRPKNIYDNIDRSIDAVSQQILSDSDLPPADRPKSCAFCNLLETSILGQGKLMAFPATTDYDCFRLMEEKRVAHTELKLFFKKHTSIDMQRSKSVGGGLVKDVFQELEETGFKVPPDSRDIFEESGELNAHFNCAAWSDGVTKTFEKRLFNVDKSVVSAAFQRCSKCNRYGASVKCCFSECTKIYHYPCAIVSGALQNANCFKIICPIHREHAFSFGVLCDGCHESGDLSQLLLCTSCGHYYHGHCLDPPLLHLTPDARAGWQCQNCKVCQSCRCPEDNNKMLKCNTCDKGYHIFCLQPAVASIPKTGWKCSSCRRCGDCGSRTPGSGPSSRWHLNYTVCDSCYQQRNKGVACPLCGKAYRHFSQRKAMKHCIRCQKHIHPECDRRTGIDPFRYICPICTNSENRQLDEGYAELQTKDSYQGSSRDSFISGNEETLSSEESDYFIEAPPPSTVKIRRTSCEQKPRKPRKSKLKALAASESEVFFPMSALLPKEYKMDDDDPTEDNKMVLISATDEFVLCQDLCVMCGSFGRGEEGRLIACAQCGQCYHSYCASIKVTQVVLRKGWRCLDCTVCEGCGQPHDEGRLLLCDECDISFHIYCLDPPLQEVPKGNWKCKWCVMCIRCGSKSPGIHCDWQMNYTLCGPCASASICCCCMQRYHDSDLMLHCQQCNRWLHGACDQVTTEEEAEKCVDYGYACPYCRPSDEPPPHLLPPPTPPTPEEPIPEKCASPVPKIEKTEVIKKPPVQYCMDGVYLSESGMKYIKSMVPEAPKKIPRPRKKLDDQMTMASEDTKVEPGLELGLKAYDFEDGKMVMDGTKDMISDSSGDKKKRPRKLQKLGIGGFVVKPRGRSLSTKESSAETGEPVPCEIPALEGGDPTELKKKPKRKPKKKTPLDESFPTYLRDAFFGKELLLSCKKLAKSQEGIVAEAHKLSEEYLKPLPDAQDAKDFIAVGPHKNLTNPNLTYKNLIKSEIESIKEEHLSTTANMNETAGLRYNMDNPMSVYPGPKGPGYILQQPPVHPNAMAGEPWAESESQMQKNILKWESDERLGLLSTISPVLYANINLPHLKIEFPVWTDRVKQIAKIWRSLPSEKRQPYLQRARENRAASRTQRSSSTDSERPSREPKNPPQENEQWKQLQALRLQQQAAAQQRLLHEQRVQGVVVESSNEEAEKNHPKQPLFHSKSLTEFPVEETPQPTKVFEKRWSSSAIDLHPETILQQSQVAKAMLPERKVTRSPPRPHSSESFFTNSPQSQLMDTHSQPTPSKMDEKVSSLEKPMDVLRPLFSGCNQEVEETANLEQLLLPFENKHQHLRDLLENNKKEEEDSKLERQRESAQPETAKIDPTPLLGEVRVESGKRPTAADIVKDFEEVAQQHDAIDVLPVDVGELELDDDELLGLGADFNILEYADPELDKSLVGEGEKSNILDEHLDLDDKDEDLEDKDLIAQEEDKKCLVDDTPKTAGGSLLELQEKKVAVVAPKVDLRLVKEEPKPSFTGCSQTPFDPSIDIKLEKSLVEGAACSGMQKQQTLPIEQQLISPPPSYRMVAQLKQQEEVAKGNLLLQRQPLLLQEQPLLLEDLVEQEKREQMSSALLSDIDFERLKDDVFSGPQDGLDNFGPPMLWQNNQDQPQPPPPTQKVTPGPFYPAAEEISDPEKLSHEKYLLQQHTLVSGRQRSLETEVVKLRKSKKALNAKQRQLRKNGSELAEQDALELARVSRDQAVLQKQLDTVRKQLRQNTTAIQDYRLKQQKRQQLPQSPLHVTSSPQNSQSPLHFSLGTPQSPLLPPSPLTSSSRPFHTLKVETAHSSERFLKKNPFEGGLNPQGFPLSSSPLGDNNLRGLLDMKKPVADESSSSGKKTPPSEENTAQSTSLILSDAKPEISPSVDTVPQSILSQSLPSSVSNTLKFTLRQTGMPTGCPAQPTELAFGSPTPEVKVSEVMPDPSKDISTEDTLDKNTISQPEAALAAPSLSDSQEVVDKTDAVLTNIKREIVEEESHTELPEKRKDEVCASDEELEKEREQNVLLKQLLQNCPSADTPALLSPPALLGGVSKDLPKDDDQNMKKLDVPFDINNLQNKDVAGKKPSYLDVRRAQLEREPTPPPPVGGMALPPKQPRKRPKKKEAAAVPPPKKKCRVVREAESLLNRLPPLRILEPVIKPDFNAVPAYGMGQGKENGLKGRHGNATLPGQKDPYSCESPDASAILPPSSPPYRGFYNQEFPNINKAIENNDLSVILKSKVEKEVRSIFRDLGSPDTVISCSSVESEPCRSRFPTLVFVDHVLPPHSPIMHLHHPLPIRAESKTPRPETPMEEMDDDRDKENIPDESWSKMDMGGVGSGSSKGILQDAGNVSVTLTLSSAAAQDICGVLSALADLLRIPIPASYEIVERTATPPSQKLGLYRNGKTTSDASMESLLNGQPRFCRHCDIVVLSAGIRKKAADLPYAAREEGDEEEEVIFCSTNCYMQFALTHRSTAVLEEKEAAAVVDHIGTEDGLMKTELMEVDQEIKTEPEEVFRKWRNVRYKFFTQDMENLKLKRKEETSEKMGRPFYHTIKPSQMPKDERKCIFCHGVGDGETNGSARLLNVDVDKWVHLNCALWSVEVYETVNGALMNVETAFRRSRHLQCFACRRQGASVRCFKTRCPALYHFPCARSSHCAFFKDKTMLCPQHAHRGNLENKLESVAVFRRVYINREEHKQVASMIQDEKFVLRIGNLIFLHIGQLLPTQIQAFHNANCIYPVGYKVIRMYWSMRKLGRRSQYECTINECSGKPEFAISVKDSDIVLKDTASKAAWQKVLYPIEKMRRQAKTIKIFPDFITGDDLFGLTEPAVLRIVESLPGVDTLNDYNFRYGRSPFLELPLAINPTGCARSEPKLRTHFKRPHGVMHHTASSMARSFHSPFSLEASSPYSKQFVYSKSSQYRKMKTEWRNNVYLARSRIQGLGLYAARDLEKHTMVIEYIGQVIRNEISERNEAIYEAQHRGIYMFRLDEQRVIDATLSGGLARYINHSCNPNCVAETVQIDRDNKILIITSRRISRGEELSYDYKFEVEDDQHKIPCLCGAPNCRKWMN